jgi:hypothetical protein
MAEYGRVVADCIYALQLEDKAEGNMRLFTDEVQFDDVECISETDERELICRIQVDEAIITVVVPHSVLRPWTRVWGPDQVGTLAVDRKWAEGQGLVGDLQPSSVTWSIPDTPPEEPNVTSSWPNKVEVVESPGGQDSPTGMEDVIFNTCAEVAEFLIEKNKAYGNSALNPVRVFSRCDPVEQLRVRIDDKLSRLARGEIDYNDEDVILDLIGYMVLLRIAQKQPPAKPFTEEVVEALSRRR